MNKELEKLKKIEEIKKEFADILVEFGKVVEDVAIAGVRNPVGFKPTHLWKPAHDRAIERLLETTPSHDEIKREAYNEGLKNGWELANNNIKDVLKPWFKGVHNIKLPDSLTQSKEGGE